MNNPFINIIDASPNLLSSIKNLYICPSFACNLSCSHCYLRLIKLPKNIDAVCNTLSKVLEYNKDVKFDLFGGEPMLLSEEDLTKLEPLITSRHLTINTNLLDIDDFHFNFLRKADSIDTSFDLNRFRNPYEVHKFLLNLDKLKEFNMKFNIMTVLDKNILDMGVDKFLNIIKSMQPKHLELKIFIGPDEPDFEKVDDFLCEMFHNWNTDICNLMFVEIARMILWGRKWKDYCYGKNYTLFPDGRIRMGCPYANEFYEKKECKYCEFYNVCEGGCHIQPFCRFPKKLYKEMCKLNKNELFFLASKGLEIPNEQFH